VRNSALLVWPLALALIVAAPGLAGPLAPKKPSDLVTLTRGSTPCPLLMGFFLVDTRLQSDGTSAPFSIPPKSVLVVTGMLAASNGGTPGIAGSTIGVGLSVGATTPIYQTVVADASDAFTAQTSVPSGIVVKSGTNICVVAQDVANPFPTLETGFGVQVYGFLAKDK